MISEGKDRRGEPGKRGMRERTDGVNRGIGERKKIDGANRGSGEAGKGQEKGARCKAQGQRKLIVYSSKGMGDRR